MLTKRITSIKNVPPFLVILIFDFHKKWIVKLTDEQRRSVVKDFNGNLNSFVKNLINDRGITVDDNEFYYLTFSECPEETSDLGTIPEWVDMDFSVPSDLEDTIKDIKYNYLVLLSPSTTYEIKLGPLDKYLIAKNNGDASKVVDHYLSFYGENEVSHTDCAFKLYTDEPVLERCHAFVNLEDFDGSKEIEYDTIEFYPHNSTKSYRVKLSDKQQSLSSCLDSFIDDECKVFEEEWETNTCRVTMSPKLYISEYLENNLSIPNILCGYSFDSKGTLETELIGFD